METVMKWVNILCFKYEVRIEIYLVDTQEKKETKGKKVSDTVFPTIASKHSYVTSLYGLEK